METPKDVSSRHIDNAKSDRSSVAEGEGEAGELRVALDNYEPGTDVEKKLVRKIDFIMIPMLWWMCVLAYVDRNNIVRTPDTSIRP